MCTNKDIQELLPAYGEQSLSGDEQQRVRDHLDRCADCREELELIRMMTEEPVPDPGEAFWAEMPGRIAREVRRRRREKMPSALSGLAGSLFFPRWAWAAAGVLLVAVVSMILFRSEPERMNMTAREPSGEEAAYAEDWYAGEPVDVAALEAKDLDTVSNWLDKELSVVGNGTSGSPAEDADTALDEELDTLDVRQLELLLKKLEESKREV